LSPPNENKDPIKRKHVTSINVQSNAEGSNSNSIRVEDEDVDADNSIMS
jgi:hypothetical protein